MKKSGFPRDYKVYIVLAVLFVALVFMIPRTSSFSYDYKKGSPWLYETLIAQFDFPVLKTDAQLQEERETAGSSVISYYIYSEDVVSSTIRSIESANLGDWTSLRTNIKEIVNQIYSRGILSDADEADADSQTTIYIQRDKRASKRPVSDVYRTSEARSLLSGELAKLQDVECNVDSLCRYSGIYDMLVPNLIFDQQTTDLVHDEAVDYISPTSGVVNAGQLIVSNGEIITSEIMQLLDSYKAEYDSSLGYDGPRALLWMGNGLIAFCLVLILFFTIFFTNPYVFGDFNRFLYLIVIYFLTVALGVVVERAGHQYIYLVPFSLMALYLVAFFQKKVVYPVYMVALLPMMIFAHDGVELFVMYLTAGVVAIYSFDHFNKGWQQFITAFFVYVSLLVTFMMFHLAEGMKGFNDYQSILYMGLGSLFSVAGYPLIYLFERMFMLVSNSRLQELCDTNNKLLRDLSHKAPGTFQHSLQVMNMADAVARSMDANVDLVRCGALYHDIGKTVNPLCFIENEAPGTDYHAGLSPRESAKAIIKHVSDGVALAEKEGLPEVIKNFIISHHGTTFTAFFYNKYLEQGGDPEEKDDFFYKGKKPETKEQGILMICDSIEAASRTLKDFSAESISTFVENICNGKINQGQLEEADITMKELHTMKSVLKEYLQQAHHARVDYPKQQLK